MKLKKSRRFMLSVFAVFSVICIFISGSIATAAFPMQKLKITAVTEDNEFDLSGTTDLYYLKLLDAGDSYSVIIKFMAVENKSEKLFTSYGSGQYVYLGCSELKAECGFISLGRFLHIKLKLNAAQTNLKLEDGMPFDITRYSLKPVLTIEK